MSRKWTWQNRLIFNCSFSEQFPIRFKLIHYRRNLPLIAPRRHPAASGKPAVRRRSCAVLLGPTGSPRLPPLLRPRLSWHNIGNQIKAAFPASTGCRSLPGATAATQPGVGKMSRANGGPAARLSHPRPLEVNPGDGYTVTPP